MRKVNELSAPSLTLRESEGVFFYTDEGLFRQSGVRVAFTGRSGGVSLSPFDGLNLGSHVGDDREAVLRNRELAMRALGAPEGIALVVPSQVHGTEIVTVGSPDADDVEQCAKAAAEGADGIAVSTSGVAAMLCFADCMPLVAVSPDARFVVAHAGWRGVYEEIAARAIGRLSESSRFSPSDFNVYIGPYIHAECFEVGADLTAKFEDKFGSGVIFGERNVDLGQAVRKTLRAAGVSECRIADVNRCTVCNSAEFFSYRASGGKCGRHGAVAFAIDT